MLSGLTRNRQHSARDKLPPRGLIVKQRRKFTVIIERDEAGYYVASVPALHGCHTQAKNLDTLMKRVREVVELCLEDGERATPSLELVGIQQIAV